MRYDIYYRDARVGAVTERDCDFPNMWGVIAFDDSMSQPASEQAARLTRFIELNRASTRLADAEDQGHVRLELIALDKQLEDFNDYIESDDWLLVDETGNALPILVPIFRHDGDIVWRWNPDK